MQHIYMDINRKLNANQKYRITYKSVDKLALTDTQFMIFVSTLYTISRGFLFRFWFWLYLKMEHI